MRRTPASRGPGRAGLALVVAAAAMLSGSVAASGQPGDGEPRTLRVKPGPGAIQRAIDRADAGDRLRIKSGRYREVVEVTKPLSVVGERKGPRPVIDARCDSEYTVAVQASGVTLKGLKVIGATDLASAGTEVDFRLVNSGRAEDLVVRDTCDAEYGINVLQTGPVELVGNRATGFSDAGIYVGSIEDTLGGTLLVRGNDAYANNKGAIVEFSAAGDILVEDNDFHDNALPGTTEPNGLLVHDSDGVRINANRIRNNGAIGVRLTSNSNGNVFRDNEITGNPTDILDEGSGNCGSGNTFVTGGPLAPC